MSTATKLLLGAVFAVVLAICVVGAVLTVVARDDTGSIEINLGDDTFAEIDAEQGSDLIAAQGPLIFPDPSGGDRPLLVQHLGGDPATGWFAMAAIAPGTEACVVEWRPDQDQFRDCSGSVYPADGTGLTRFRTTVEDGTVIVDLRTEIGDDGEPVDAPTATTAAPA